MLLGFIVFWRLNIRHQNSPALLPISTFHPLALCAHNRFDPVSETFTQTLVKSADPILAGNGGSVHAFDADGRVM